MAIYCWDNTNTGGDAPAIFERFFEEETGISVKFLGEFQYIGTSNIFIEANDEDEERLLHYNIRKLKLEKLNALHGIEFLPREKANSILREVAVEFPVKWVAQDGQGWKLFSNPIMPILTKKLIWEGDLIATIPSNDTNIKIFNLKDTI